MSDFLFHKVSKKEKEKIRKEAKAIMDSFSAKLSKIEKLPEDSGIDRDFFEREENSGKCSDLDRNIMFENAPNKNGGFIKAEKGGWQ